MSAGILDMRRMPPRAVPPPPPSASAAAAAAALPHVPPHQTPVAIPVADHPGGLSLPHENADCDTTRKWIIDLLVHPDNGYSEEEAKATADKHRGRFRVMTILTLEKKQSLFGILEGAIIHEAVTRKVEVWTRCIIQSSLFV
ncbi:hypothetical protein L228DRAFT_181821 [Xylona heveae TC161]|uniref:Uncharacterized protein n=1 Tax=Xylona heveae (strain CBS 132557 / TC161) TaxID=1328760 RepID=A0A165FFC6_XYLHT|nr:hypothetical protein L228DRAFT_181821 [Xylona heveae TC161]KZF20911.1 hypothetical protein L228DRAFT_181821 [Xylona heveae TC161]